MNGHATFLSRRTLYGVLAVVLVLIALGSFVDYPLSLALYDATNPFAMFLPPTARFPPPWAVWQQARCLSAGAAGTRRWRARCKGSAAFWCFWWGWAWPAFCPRCICRRRPPCWPESAWCCLPVRFPRPPPGKGGRPRRDHPRGPCHPSCHPLRTAGGELHQSLLGRPACGWSPTTRKPISSPGGGGALR